MFIGNPHVTDRDDRLRGVASRIGNIIHITDGKTDRILDVVTANTVIDNVHRKSLKDTLETFDFRVIGGMRYERYLEKYNRIIIPDEDDGLIEFIIDEVGKYRDSEGLK